jgi:hypothetical protein
MEITHTTDLFRKNDAYNLWRILKKRTRQGVLKLVVGHLGPVRHWGSRLCAQSCRKNGCLWLGVEVILGPIGWALAFTRGERCPRVISDQWLGETLSSLSLQSLREGYPES